MSQYTNKKIYLSERDSEREREVGKERIREWKRKREGNVKPTSRWRDCDKLFQKEISSVAQEIRNLFSHQLVFKFLRLASRSSEG